MIKKIELTEKMNEITQIFSENFDEIYTFMEKSTKEDILNLAPTLFRKWYYGTIVENTILSPANIISVSDTVENLKDSVFTINLSIDKTKRGKNKFIYEGVIYTIENHPLIDDLKTVAKMCLPDAPTTENGIVTKEYALEISKNLSIKDPFYAEYLFCLLKRFGLFNKLLSIHSYRVQLSNSGGTFFKKDNETLLENIISIEFVME